MDAEFYTPAKTFHRLLGYLDHIGLNSANIAATAGLNAERLHRVSAEEQLPMVQFSALYNAAATAMQELDHALPWAAGIGTEAFRFLCYSIIHTPTLGDALIRAARFQRLLYPITRNRIELSVREDEACISYTVDADAAAAIFVPEDWERTTQYDALAKFSGLKIWYAFIGWLVGRNAELRRVTFAATPLSNAHQASLEDIFQCPLQFNAEITALYLDTDFLQHRLIHSDESLESFLENAIYTLGASEAKPSSTSRAVKSLLARKGPAQLPGLEDMAKTLHMSPSSLRRHLQAEGNSYRQIKDQYRRDLAIRMLREGKLKVHEISEELGFLEPGSFIRSFKNWTGSTPKAFQEQLGAVH